MALRVNDDDNQHDDDEAELRQANVREHRHLLGASVSRLRDPKLESKADG